MKKLLTLLALSTFILTSCSSNQSRTASSVVDYLYSGKAKQVKRRTPHLTLPLNIGIAFVPEKYHDDNSLPEAKKMLLLENVSDKFRALKFVEKISVVPSSYLRSRGGFDNLDQISSLYGFDVVALVSYDQTQFTDSSRASLTYTTLIGAYFIPGEKNDTSTLLDTAVFDIKSRNMLFRAPGTNFLKGKSAPVNLSKELREDSEKSFNLAAIDMTNNLEKEMATFRESIKKKPDTVTIDYKKGHTQQSTGGALCAPLFVLLLGFLGLVYRRKIRLDRH
ncbi:MAG: rhombotarget lipoprotein [Pseudomonadota bacterium]